MHFHFFETFAMCWIFSGVNVFIARSVKNGSRDDLSTFPRFLLCTLAGPFARML